MRLDRRPKSRAVLSNLWQTSAMTEGVRARRRDDVTRRVLEIGRQHLTEYGAAALSLRAVTRDLGMVSSAVYRYVASRDELLTLLVVDAYTELGDVVDARLAELSAGRLGRSHPRGLRRPCASGRCVNPRGTRCCTAVRYRGTRRPASGPRNRGPG